MGQGLSKADIATQSYLLAAIFSLIKENREMTNAQHNTQQLLADLQIRLEVTFTLTPEHSVLRSGPVRSFFLFRKDQDQDRS